MPIFVALPVVISELGKQKHARHFASVISLQRYAHWHYQPRFNVPWNRDCTMIYVLEHLSGLGKSICKHINVTAARKNEAKLCTPYLGLFNMTVKAISPFFPFLLSSGKAISENCCRHHAVALNPLFVPSDHFCPTSSILNSRSV